MNRFLSFALVYSLDLVHRAYGAAYVSKLVELNVSVSSSEFGRWVGVNDEFVAITDPLNSDILTHNGAVYIYKYNHFTSEWNQTQILIPSDAEVNGAFGEHMAIYENYMIVGADGSQQVYIFKLNETDASNPIWNEAYIISDPVFNSSFAFKVDITDGFAIVGDRFNDDKAEDAGASHIFTRSVQILDNNTELETWEYSATLTASDAEASDYFGGGVSIATINNSVFALVGAPFEDYGEQGNAGSAYVFSYDNESDSWNEIAKLFASDGASKDQFGWQVNLDETSGRAIIGAHNYNNDEGASFIFEYNALTNSWDETYKLSPSSTSSERFGYSVSIYKNICIVGARDEDDTKGAAYVFELTNGSWEISEHLVDDNGEVGDYFGKRVAIYKDFVVVASDEVNSNKVWIYGGIEPSFAPTTLPTATPTSTPSITPSNAPSSYPTTIPSSAPTTGPVANPTFAPSMAPSNAPTNTLCDETVQEYSTFRVCNFLVELEHDFSDWALDSSDYCKSMNNYFKCENENTTITHIVLNNTGVSGQMTNNVTVWLAEAVTEGVLDSFSCFDLSMHCFVTFFV